MEREACVCDHGFERSDLCAEIIYRPAPTLPTHIFVQSLRTFGPDNKTLLSFRPEVVKDLPAQHQHHLVTRLSN